MAGSRRSPRCLVAGVSMIASVLAGPLAGLAHPLGNFSISHYAAIRIGPDAIELRYLIDMAEIPTFQEIQEAGLVPEDGHPSLTGYLPRLAARLDKGLMLEVNGRRLRVRSESTDIIFPPGAAGLPTMKVGIVYRGGLERPAAGLNHLRYRDENYAGRAGWKEIVSTAGPGIELVSSTAPESDRSRQLSDYPTDLLQSPPQDLEAQMTFTVNGSSQALAPGAAAEPPSSKARPGEARAGAVSPGGRVSPPASAAEPGTRPVQRVAPVQRVVPVDPEVAPVSLRANRQASPRDSFTELVATSQLSPGIVLIALAMAAGLGAFHALEPGHGKTVVAAYLVGSRGTPWHALILGLVVTASHTAGVYLLGAVTLYASSFVLPERLYPWLGVVSGSIIASLGFALFLRRYSRPADHHGHAHSHSHTFSSHSHPLGSTDHSHEHGDAGAHRHGGHAHHAHGSGGAVSLRELFALGVTGGIVPCPAALVVLLSALSLRRVGFGLLLIVAFSAGLAVVLIAVGLLIVYARRFVSRFHREGPLITRWLPLSSAAVIAVLGAAIAVQSLVTAGILQVRPPSS